MRSRGRAGLVAVTMGLALALLVLRPGIGLGASVSPVPEAPAPDDEPVLLEIRLGDLAARTVQAYRQGDEPLLPLAQFFDLASIRATLSPAGRLEARLQPDDVALVVEAGRDTAFVGRRRVPIPPGTLRFVDGELYLGVGALGELLGLRFAVDWSELEVVVVDPTTLPVAALRRREAARASLRAGLRDEAPSRVLAFERPLWNGVVVDYSLFSQSADALGGSTWRVAAGADLLGGSLELGAASEGPARDGDVRFDGSWLGVWRDGRAVRQLRVGDGPATGLRARALRGISVTNAPYLRPSYIGEGSFVGEVPAGWQVEAWRAGQLVGFDSAGTDGAFAFDLPVAYGDNPVELVALGPHGERRVVRRVYRVPTLLLPEKRFEYGLSGGECRFAYAGCEATGNADLRYGVTRRWTVLGGADAWRDGAPHPVQPYAGLVGSVGSAWTVELDAALRGAARMQLSYEPSTDAHVRAEVVHYADSLSARTNPLGRRSRMIVAGFVRPSARHESFYLEGVAERNTTPGGSDEHLRVGAAMYAGATQLHPYARWDRLNGDGELRVGLVSYLLPRPSWSRLLRGAWIRGTAEVDQEARPRQASLAVARTLTPTVRAELGAEWVRGVPGPTVTLTLNSLFPALRSLTTATAPRTGPATLSQQIQGSVLVNGQTRAVSFAPGPALQRAGVEGRVFLDENGDGRWDEGESGAAGVRVMVGSGSVLTDSLGHYRAWDVVPFEPVMVQVDSLSFASPLWLATYPTTALVAGPNHYTTLDIPLTLGAVLEGRVVSSGGGVGGVGLVVAERATGVRRTVTTFTDGAFYLTGLRPGDYDITVEPRSLEALGSDAAPVSVRVAGGFENQVPPVDIVLTPRAIGNR